MEQPAKPPLLPPDVSGQAPIRETLALAKLVTDGGTQVRSEISELIVAEYVEALGEGARFPPVVVFRTGEAHLLADGFHRVRAYRQAGRDEIEADVYEGGPGQALWFALGANRAHGQRLNEGDKRRAIELAYEAWPDVSQRRIAAHVGCNQRYVGIVRAQLSTTTHLPDTVVGRDGRRRPATRSAKAPKPSGTDDEAPAPLAREPSSRASVSAGASPVQASAGCDTPRPESVPVPPPPAAAEPPSDATSSEPRQPEPTRSRTGVTARQAARDRSNRIVSVVADNAKNLTAQDDLIDYAALDREKLPQWIADLEEARRLLAGFICRLREEL